MRKMNTVLIVPTGIGAEIGGHAGDANPVAKLLASVSDKLITHPNVVNASDINEMTDNTLYVEGSILSDFMLGKTFLQEVKYNRILLLVNEATPDIINSASAARMTIGARVSVQELTVPLKMKATINDDGTAGGVVEGWEELVEQVKGASHLHEAIAIATPIDVDKDIALRYVDSGTGVNPWGAVEAKASSMIAQALQIPVAHAPAGDTLGDLNKVVDPRLAAEFVSICYVHCILKGLHKAPRPISCSRVDMSRNYNYLSDQDIDVVVIPNGCWSEELEYLVGRGTARGCNHNIAVIVVTENTTVLKEVSPLYSNVYRVNNYWDAAGIIASLNAGIFPNSVRVPKNPTFVFTKEMWAKGKNASDS